MTWWNGWETMAGISIAAESQAVIIEQFDDVKDADPRDAEQVARASPSYSCQRLTMCQCRLAGFESFCCPRHGLRSRSCAHARMVLHPGGRQVKHARVHYDRMTMYRWWRRARKLRRAWHTARPPAFAIGGTVDTTTDRSTHLLCTRNHYRRPPMTTGNRIDHRGVGRDRLGAGPAVCRRQEQPGPGRPPPRATGGTGRRVAQAARGRSPRCGRRSWSGRCPAGDRRST